MVDLLDEWCGMVMLIVKLLIEMRCGCEYENTRVSGRRVDEWMYGRMDGMMDERVVT